MKATNLGIKVAENKTFSVLLYADDGLIIGESSKNLQTMQDSVSGYGRDFKVKFSSGKSQVLIINETVQNGGQTWNLRNEEIGQVTEYKYMGMWVKDKGYEKTKTEKMLKALQWYGCLGSVAKFIAKK